MSQGGPSNLTPGAAGSGKVVQVQEVSTSAVVLINSSMPYTNSIPTNTQGFELLSITFTPINVNNKLFFTFTAASAVTSVGIIGTAALFQDSIVNALAATNLLQGREVPAAVFNYSMIAGTTSPTTFKIRVGPNSTLITINGFVGSARYGGTSSTNFTIEEISV